MKNISKIILILTLFFIAGCSNQTGPEKRMDLSQFNHTHEWYEAMGFPDGNIPNKLLGQFAELRSQLWERHYSSLSDEDKKLVDSDSHPFYNADKYNDAVKFAKDFIAEKEKLDYVKNVSVDYYHGHSLVLTVHLKKAMNWREYKEAIPELYRGIQVFCIYHEKNENI